MKNTVINIVFCIPILFFALFRAQQSFLHVSKQNIVDAQGNIFRIKGTNLGNWLNPEGYMFGFTDTSSYRLINDAFCEIAGTEFTEYFWRNFQENYITKEDIEFLKSMGCNTIRVPFHYKLFTSESYMGSRDPKRGFELLDRLVKWCAESGVYVILDMHDAPGGQTGDNIDDSYGYPWLFTDEVSQEKFLKIWKEIARHYSDSKTILGYDLLNEPIAPFFKDDLEMLNAKLEPLYKKAAASIRSVDRKHILIFGGAQWDTNFSVFHDWEFDRNIMYTCHLYWADPGIGSLEKYIEFRAKTNLPMYMGETGENTDEWIKKFTETLNSAQIGWTYWPYKKMKSTKGIASVTAPDGWEKIIDFTKTDRSSFEKIRAARPDQKSSQKAMLQLLENMKLKNCAINQSYIHALGLH